MAECNAQAILSASACWLIRRPVELEAIKVNLLCRILTQTNPMATCDPDELISDSKCWLNRPLIELQSIQTQLLCELVNGGAPGATCVIGCAVTGPAIPGPCIFSIAYSPGPNPGYWLWDESRGLWDEIVAPGP